MEDDVYLRILKKLMQRVALLPQNTFFSGSFLHWGTVCACGGSRQISICVYVGFCWESTVTSHTKKTCWQMNWKSSKLPVITCKICMRVYMCVLVGTGTMDRTFARTGSSAPMTLKRKVANRQWIKWMMQLSLHNNI